MRVIVKLMSGETHNIRVYSEFNLFATGYEVQESIKTYMSSLYEIPMKMVMFRNGEKLDFSDEIDSGTLIDIFLGE